MCIKIFYRTNVKFAKIQLGEFVKTICINILTCKRVLAHIIKMRGLDVPFAIFQPSHHDSKQSSGQSHKVAGAVYTGFDDCTEGFRFFGCSKKRLTSRIMEPHRAQRKVQLVCFFSVYSLDSSDGPPQTSTDNTNFYVKIFLA